MADHVRIWNLLRTLLHGTRWSAAIADQRATVPADRPDQRAAGLQRSVPWQPSGTGDVRHAFDKFDARCEPPAALHPGLGPEYPACVWLRFAARSRVRGYEGHQAAALHRRKSGIELRGRFWQ